MNAAGDAVLLARVTVSLIVVLLLAVLVARLARRSVRGRGHGLHVLERMALSREASVAVVSVAGRGLVLGVTAQGVRVLGEVDAETLARTYPEPEDVEPGAIRRPARLGARPIRGTRSDAGAGTGAGGSGGTAVSGVEVGPDGVKVTRLVDGARPPARQGTGSVLDPRTWRQAVQALRDLTVRRG